MPQGKQCLYEFGSFQLDPVRHLVLRDDHPLPIPAKLFDTLLLLVENRGRVVEKGELLQALWPDTFVEEGSLSQNIFLLRKLLGDDRNGHSFIRTAPRKGYEFIAAVTEIEVSTTAVASPMAEYWSRHTPFRSLQVFEPEDAWLFFGRKAEVHDLLGRLKHSPVVAMVGNSGSGKSSLLRAGLIPALGVGHFCEANALNGSNGSGPSGGSWRVAVLRPSASPFDCLAEALPSQLAPELSVGEQTEFIADCRNKIATSADALHSAVVAMVLSAADKVETRQQRCVLLVIDQFEELFTLTSKREVREQYIECLLAAARLDSAVPVHLVLSLRADFYGHCLDHPGLSRCLEKNLYNVPRMTPEQMRETIEKRLQLAGSRAEPGLIESLLDDVGNEPGNLALLEHALGQLWERCGGPGCKFTNHAYAEIGRLQGALGRHADEVYRDLEDEEQKLLAQRIFLALVHLGEGAQDTRRRVAKAEFLGIGEPEQVEKLLSRLASSRLIAIGREGEETFVEVSHEALIREWPALREWIRENREELGLERRLQQSAEEWQELKKDAGALLQGARLAQAEDWLGMHSDATELLRSYVHASVEACNETARKEREAQQRDLAREKQTGRRFRWFTYALAVFLTIAIGSAWFAYRGRVLEKSRAMAAQAEEMVSRDHGQAIDLAIRSWETARTNEAHLALAKTIAENLLTMHEDGPVTFAEFSPDGRRILSVSRNGVRLRSAFDGHLLAVLDHDDYVEGATFSNDGRRILTSGDDSIVRIWDGNDGHLLKLLRGHLKPVKAADFSPDGKLIATGDMDNTARVWDCETGRLLATLEGHSASLMDIRFSPDGRRIVTTSVDKTARIWDPMTGGLIAILRGHTDMLSVAEFSPNGQQIATASADGTVRIWNAADSRLLSILKHAGSIERLAFSPDGQVIATASFDNTAGLWNAADGRKLFTLQHDGPVEDIRFSSDGQRILTASFDRTARVWSRRDGRLLAILQGHASQVYSAVFSSSGEQVVTSSEDQTVRTWSLSGARSVAVLRHDALVTGLEFSSDGRMFATASSDQKARLWNMPDGRLRFALTGHSDRVLRVAFSPDATRALTTSADGTARIWSTADGRLLTVLRGHTDKVGDASFSPDGQRIVTASRDNTARLWNTDGILLATLKGHTGTVWRARFSPDSQRIVTSSEDNTARVWSVNDGHLLFSLRGHRANVIDARFSPDGQRIVTGSYDTTARVWNATNGALLATLKGHTGQINGVVFSPDGRHLLTLGGDNTVRVWNMDDGRLLATLQGHTDQIFGAEFSPDGRRIVTASLDNTARVWDSSDGRLLNTLQGHAYQVIRAAFSPDGKHIVTTSLDQTARIWKILTLDDIARILSK